MIQKSVRIGEVDVPVVDVDGVEWFPISYLSEKVLLRKGNILFNDNYIKRFIIDYGFDTGGIQEVKCVSLKGIEDYAKTVRKGRMNVEQSKAFNTLMNHLDIDLQVSENKQFIYNPSNVIKNKLNVFETDAYLEIKKEMTNECWQLCSKCEVYYPFHLNFFRENQTSPNGLNTFCRKCGWTDKKNKDSIKLNDKKLEKVYYVYGEEIYKLYRDHKTIDIYLHYLETRMKKYPYILRNKEDFKIIIKYLHNENLIEKDLLTQKYLIENHKLPNDFSESLTLHEIYTMLFGEGYYYSPWKYKCFKFDEISLTFDLANAILSNYIKEFNITINDILKHNYQKIVGESGIKKFVDKDILYFLIQYYKFEYAGYKFSTKSQTYYKYENNLLFDLKYLIEEDLKLNKDKIPLYLTKNVLQKHCRPLYHWIVTNKNGSIFEWVDKLYPGKYDLADFEINAYRDEFDSDTEAFVHEILTEEFGSNVIYNQRNNSDTIKLKGKVPDWFLFTNQGVWVIEYFGFFDARHTDNNRIRDYKAKMEDKISVYESIVGYNFLYLYQNDVDNNFSGLRQKIGEIKVKLGASTD